MPKQHVCDKICDYLFEGENRLTTARWEEETTTAPNGVCPTSTIWNGIPGGKLRMKAIMDRITCQERELKFLETHMDKMRGSIARPLTRGSLIL